MEQGQLSMGKFLLNLLIRPRSAFQGMKVSIAVWLVIIMATAAIIFSASAVQYALVKGFSSETIMEQPETKKMIEEGTFDEEIFEETLSSPVVSSGIIAIGIFGALFSFAAGWMIKSSILLGAVSLAGGKLGWKESVAIVGASWIPFFFHHLLLGASSLLCWQIAPVAGAGGVLISHLNVFVIWNLALLTIGFAAVAGIPRIKAFACAAGYQAVVILIHLGLLKLGGAFTGGAF